jgi:hypothetical protein
MYNKACVYQAVWEVLVMKRRCGSFVGFPGVMHGVHGQR